MTLHHSKKPFSAPGLFPRSQTVLEGPGWLEAGWDLGGEGSPFELGGTEALIWFTWG